MRKAFLAGVLALLMLTPAALAEVCEGATVAVSSVSVEAEAGGVLEALSVLPGMTVSEGDVLGSVRTTKVFAAQEGTIARLNAGEGDSVDGTVLELAPVEKYRICCTVDGAYETAANMLVHSGEQLYIKCTANGTHRGVGLVTEIDGSEFQVLAIGGELYIGETVCLYRDAEFSGKQRVGIGTVVTNDTQAYESRGTIARLHVAEGEYVERGELLYEIADAEDVTITAPVAGIVTEVAAQKGDNLKGGSTIVTIVPQDQICVEVQVDQTAAAAIHEGDAAGLVYASDPEADPAPGTVVSISRIAENGFYTVRIAPESAAGLRLGMTTTVRLGE